MRLTLTKNDMARSEIYSQIAEIYSQIAKLIRIAETGEQWAEICRLEALAESLTS
jgi:hypothetical protein